MKYFSLFVTLLILSGCSAGMDIRTAAVIDRASFDFNCPKEQIEVREFSLLKDGARLAARGCGRSAEYQLACNWYDECAALHIQPNPVIQRVPGYGSSNGGSTYSPLHKPSPFKY